MLTANTHKLIYEVGFEGIDSSNKKHEVSFEGGFEQEKRIRLVECFKQTVHILKHFRQTVHIKKTF